MGFVTGFLIEACPRNKVELNESRLVKFYQVKRLKENSTENSTEKNFKEDSQFNKLWNISTKQKKYSTYCVIYMGPKIFKDTTKIRICEMYIGNPKTLKIGSGTKLFITFLSLRFFDMRRERHNFLNKHAAHFIDPNWSRLGETKNWPPSSRLESQHSDSTNARASRRPKLVPLRRAPKIVFLVRSLSLN